MPSNHKMIRMTAIVSSIGSRLLRASSGARAISSNRCATSPSVHARVFVVVLLAFAALGSAAELAAAQDSVQQPNSTSEKSATAATLTFLAGGATGLVAHESGHLLFDAIFGAHAGVKGVSFHGIPFFAITHDSGLPARQEFV